MPFLLILFYLGQALAQDYESVTSLLEQGISPQVEVCSLATAEKDPIKCEPPITDEDFKLILDETREKYFPDLANISIRISEFKSDQYFLQAQPRQNSYLKHARKRAYEIQLNRSLLKCPPNKQALIGILIHELIHIQDYQKMSTLEIAGFALKYITNHKFKVEYERETDLKAMKLGAGKGLIGYRNWVYQWLTPKQIAKKKRFYYTPEEITQWERENPPRP